MFMSVWDDNFVRYFGTMSRKFGMKIYYYLLFLIGKLRKNLFWTNKKFVYLNIITNFRDIVPN